MHGTFGDLQGKIMSMTFWNEQVWKFIASNPKLYDKYSFVDVEIEKKNIDDQYNHGNLLVLQVKSTPVDSSRLK